MGLRIVKRSKLAEKGDFSALIVGLLSENYTKGVQCNLELEQSVAKIEVSSAMRIYSLTFSF